MLENQLTTGGNNKKKLQANIWKLYLFCFFQHLIFAYVIERLFGLERGITIQQMVYIEIIYAAVVMLLEIPTGVLADRWSRKNLIIICAVFTFFEFYILIFAFNFWLFALSSVAAAVAGALESGTENALFYDSLKLTGKEREFEKVIGRKNIFASLSNILAALGGGLMASHFGYTSTFWFSLIGVSLSVFIAFTLYEPEIRTEENTGTESTAASFNFKDTILFLKENSQVRFVMLYAIILGANINYIDEYWQIYFKDIGIPLEAYGIFSVSYSVIMSITAFYAYRLKENFNYKIIFSACIFFIGIFVLTSSFIHTAYGFLILLLVYLFFGLTEPLCLGYIHHRTASVHRATVESFYSLVLRLATIIIGLIFGYISNNLSIFLGFRFLGIVLLGYCLYYFLFQFKHLEEN
jgi:MFS family permease